MRTIFAPRYVELSTKISAVIRYFIFEGNIVKKVRLHKEVLAALKPFKNNELIFFRAYFIYILPYLSKALRVPQKQRILINHYNLLNEKFSKEEIQQLFKKGVTFYTEIDNDDTYTIFLKAVTNHLEFEGSMNLVFQLNDIKIFTLSFSFTPGYIFGCEDDQVIYISSIQGTRNEFENIRKATKYFKDNAPSVILMKMIEALAFVTGINKCLGISVENQLSFKDEDTYDRFYANYDQFWINSGAIFANGNYVINFPLTSKPILSIPQPHRNRTLKKRKKLQEMLDSALEKLTKNFHGTDAEM